MFSLGYRREDQGTPTGDVDLDIVRSIVPGFLHDGEGVIVGILDPRVTPKHGLIM